ncbi:MAG TPA: tetratricopeptide repeat protein [Anaerolineae bacterium]|nr:tetratricopeptide repeat protein [Anaerolineae bacterium]
MTGASLTNFDQLWDYDKPEETERRFRQLLPGAARNTSDYVELLTQIARTQGLQRKFDQAHQTLNTAQGLLTSELKRAEIRYLLERGRVFNSAKQPEQARPLFLEAWQRAVALGEDFHAIDAAHMLAISEPPDKQLAWNLKALELAAQSRDPRARKWLGSLYNNIGWTYHDRGQYERALEVFQQAWHWREEEGQEPGIRVARWCVARTLRSLGRVGEALEAQQALLRDYASTAEQDGYVYEELAECWLLLDRTDEAQQFFALAHRELSQDAWLVDREPARIERLKTLGKIQ